MLSRQARATRGRPWILWCHSCSAPVSTSMIAPSNSSFCDHLLTILWYKTNDFRGKKRHFHGGNHDFGLKNHQFYVVKNAPCSCATTAANLGRPLWRRQPFPRPRPSLSAQFLIFNAQFRIFNAKFLIFNAEFLIFNAKFLIKKAEFNIHRREIQEKFKWKINEKSHRRESRRPGRVCQRCCSRVGILNSSFLMQNSSF